MLTYVLEASSLLRYIDSEEGASQVEELLQASERREIELLISAVNWGEVIFILHRKNDLDRAAKLEEEFKNSIRIVPVSGEMAALAGVARLTYQVPYADCFALQLARQSAGSILVTADFDYISAAHDVQINFLPKKLRQ